MNDATSSMITTRNMKEAWPAFDILISVCRYSTTAAHPPASPFSTHKPGNRDAVTTRRGAWSERPPCGQECSRFEANGIEPQMCRRLQSDKPCREAATGRRSRLPARLQKPRAGLYGWANKSICISYDLTMCVWSRVSGRQPMVQCRRGLCGGPARLALGFSGRGVSSHF